MRKGDRVESSGETVESSVRAGESEPRPQGRRSRFWPEASGALALGLCVLALGMLGFQVVAWTRGLPGPGLPTVGGHLLAAVVAVVVQRFADRLRGWAGAAAVAGVLVVAAAVLWIFWWA